MASREPKKAIPLEVRIMFEPGRLSSACMAQAYERAVPIVRRAIASRLENRKADRDQTKRRVGGAQ